MCADEIHSRRKHGIAAVLPSVHGRLPGDGDQAGAASRSRAANPGVQSRSPEDIDKDRPASRAGSAGSTGLAVCARCLIGNDRRASGAAGAADSARQLAWLCG